MGEGYVAGQEGRSPLIDAVARFVRQRAELGHDPFVLQQVTAEQAVRWAREATLRPPIAGDDAEPSLGSPDARGGAESTHEVARPGPVPEVSGAGPAPAPSELPADHDALRTMALDCTRCRLCGERTQVVFHDGTPEARLMVIGEAPGANEDRTGVPFVGAAGRFLDLLMASVGLSREDSVYICNVIKCRPPGNRNPRADEIESCSPWLLRQIELVEPEVILAVGTFAAQLLTGRDIALGRIRGEVYSYEGIPLVVTYHPAALLRNSRWTRPTWEDFQLLRRVMAGVEP